MKKENPNQKSVNEERAKISPDRQNDAKKDSKDGMKKKKPAGTTDTKKMKRNVIIAGCCVAALAVMVAAAMAGITNKKPVLPADVASISSEVTAENTKTNRSTIREDQENGRKQEREPSKEQTDDSKTNEDKKESNGEETKDPKKPGTEEPAASGTADKPKNGTEKKTSEESAGDFSETKEPDRTPDPEPAQEAPVAVQTAEPSYETPVPTQEPQEEIYLPSEPIVTTAPHVHTWQERIRTVHHDAVTEEVKVVDQAAYTEPVYEEQPVYEILSVYICDVCGEEFENAGEHSEAHIDWETFTNPFHYHVEFRQGEQIGTEFVQTGSVTYPEKSHIETRIVKAAYDEQVPDGYVCTGCGAVQ